jgi:hypothetical protein
MRHYGYKNKGGFAIAVQSVLDALSVLVVSLFHFLIHSSSSSMVGHQSLVLKRS